MLSSVRGGDPRSRVPGVLPHGVAVASLLGLNSAILGALKSRFDAKVVETGSERCNACN